MWRRRGRDCAGRGASEGAATTRENREATRHTGPMGFKEKRRKEKGEILKKNSSSIPYSQAKSSKIKIK